MRSSVQVKSGHLLGVTKARKLALGLLLVLGEHQPRDEQQLTLQLIPNRDSEYLFPAIFRLVIYTKTYSNAQ